MDRRRHPYRTVVLGTVTYRKVPGLMPVDFKIGANMVGIMIIAVFRLYRQLRPARVFRPAIPAAGADVANVPTVLPKVSPPTTTHSRNLYFVEALRPVSVALLAPGSVVTATRCPSSDVVVP